MSLILNIETASPVCSVCIAKDGKLIDYRENSDGNSHARILTIMIQDLLSSNGILFDQLDAIAVSSGPGSYTGLRIGVSVAKGLCYSLNIPLISVPTLEGIAENVRQKTNNSVSYYLSVMDSKRIDAFVAIFDYQANEVLSTRLVTLNSDFEATILAFGQMAIGGSEKVVRKCQATFNSDQFIYVENTGYVSSSMINISERKWILKKFEDVAYFEPSYFGELELVKKQKK